MDDRFENLPDWQQRFLLEYEELANRAEKLRAILDKYDAGFLEFSPQTPIAQGIPQLSIILPFPQLFDFSELLRSNLSIFPTGSIND